MPKEKAPPTAKPEKGKNKERYHAGESRLREESVKERCGYKGNMTLLGRETEELGERKRNIGNGI